MAEDLENWKGALPSQLFRTTILCRLRQGDSNHTISLSLELGEQLPLRSGSNTEFWMIAMSNSIDK